METFVMNELNNQSFKSETITKPTLFRGFGIGDWNVLVVPGSNGILEIKYVRTRISGYQGGELVYRVTEVIDTRHVRVEQPSVVKLGNRNQGWWIQVIPSQIAKLAEEKGVWVRLVRTLKHLPNRSIADSEATEYLGNHCHRTRSYQWAEPLSGFKPTEAHYRGHYRGWECNMSNNLAWGEYVFSREVETNRIIEFLQGL